MTRVYYKIRFPAKAGKYGEWHCSNSGTNSWSTPAKVKAILTSGIRRGYLGRMVKEFDDYEVVRFTETVDIVQETVDITQL